MNLSSAILPLSYWGNIEYFSKFLLHDQIIIEVFENYQKKTYRNRCELYGPNGMQSLQIPIARGSFHKININELQISYDTPWQKNHFKSIESAYRSSPFFEYYFDDIIHLYQNKIKFLKEFNLEILNICLDWLQIQNNYQLSKAYQTENENVTDYRNIIHPKLNNKITNSSFNTVNYLQGFEQRNGFIPNLSILDLVFNLGPDAYNYILQCIESN